MRAFGRGINPDGFPPESHALGLCLIDEPERSGADVLGNHEARKINGIGRAGLQVFPGSEMQR